MRLDGISDDIAEDLAKESFVGVATIRRAELAEGPTSLTTANDQAIRQALESAGVESIDENGGGTGIRLQKPPKQKRENRWDFMRNEPSRRSTVRADGTVIRPGARSGFGDAHVVEKVATGSCLRRM
jgi:hypothetical protein